MNTYTIALPFIGPITIENNGSLLLFTRPLLERTGAGPEGTGELAPCTGKLRLHWAAYQRAV